MCLAIPARIIKLNGQSATADLHGNQVEICTALTPEAKLEDWVLVHAGFAIKVLDAAEAEATWKVLEDLSYRDADGQPLATEGGAHATPHR
jgi:hydrogenase expression/formation protein HypC